VDPEQRGYKSSQCACRWLTKRQRHRRYRVHQLQRFQLCQSDLYRDRSHAEICGRIRQPHQHHRGTRGGPGRRSGTTGIQLFRRAATKDSSPPSSDPAGHCRHRLSEVEAFEGDDKLHSRHQTGCGLIGRHFFQDHLDRNSSNSNSAMECLLPPTIGHAVSVALVSTAS
jgi:hypothetical protein